VDPIGVNRILDERRRVLLACARPASPAPVEASRRVQIDFGIAPTGEVNSAVIVASDLEDAQVERCVLERITELGFGPRDDEAQVRVRYTVDLLPE